MDTWVIILAIVNNVSMNMGVQICWNSSFVGSYGNSGFFFFFLVLRNHHIVIHNGCTILHQHTQFPFFFFKYAHQYLFSVVFKFLLFGYTFFCVFFVKLFSLYFFISHFIFYFFILFYFFKYKGDRESF